MVLCPVSETVPPATRIDWVSLARGLGVPGRRVTSMEEFNRAFAAGVAERGPALIEVAL